MLFIGLQALRPDAQYIDLEDDFLRNFPAKGQSRLRIPCCSSACKISRALQSFGEMIGTSIGQYSGRLYAKICQRGAAE